MSARDELQQWVDDAPRTIGVQVDDKTYYSMPATTLTTGSIFSGYAGLDMAVNAHFGSETAWFVEKDAAPARILAHHWPDVPNHGDITAIDWAQVEPVDILTGGFPCQDVSAAGRRAGLMHGTRTGLFHNVIEAIDTLRPGHVVLENVTGLLSADGEPWTPELTKMHDEAYDSRTIKTLNLIERTGGYAWGRKWNAAEIAGLVRRHKRALARFNAARRRLVQRAIGTVVGELAAIGYDAQWTTIAAADVGGCHRRERVFILATPADAERGGRDGRASDAIGQSVGRASAAGSGEGGSGGKSVALLPTPRATDGAKGGPNQRGSSGDLMLPSAVTLLPTPRTSDTNGPGAHGDGGLDLRTAVVQWGDYEPAIRRAELACGRPAPSPTEPNRNGNPRLSSRFAEWMMLLPDGWVTDPSIGLSRNEQLKAIGNGVVPAQAYAALGILTPIAESLGAA